MTPPVAGAAAGPTIGTTDLLKVVGLLLSVADHVGLYFAEDAEAWRVVGRFAAPIFFFLIGYARTRAVPWTWLVLGAGLTAVDHLTAAPDSGTVLNILLNFALLRAALPSIEAWIDGGMPAGAAPGRRAVGDAGAGTRGEAWSGSWNEAWRTALLVAALAALVPVLDPHLEYGAEGWLWALLGLWARRAAEDPAPGRAPIRDGVAAAAALVYVVREIGDYAFEGAAVPALALLVAGLAVGLARFRRRPLAWQPPPAAARLVALAGRHTLELYAASLFAMQVVAYLLGGTGADDDG